MSLRDLRIPTQQLSLDAESFSESFINHLQHTRGKHPSVATQLDSYVCLSRTVRDRLFDRWTRTWQTRVREQPKRVYYLSMEFLLGRLLEDSLHNLGALGAARNAMQALGVDLAELLEQEPDPGLGNGGLGRLAACFLDSMATLGIAGMGYGLRYEYGIFRQDIVAGRQREQPDQWLRYGNPWEVVRPEHIYTVRFGGRVIQYTGSDSRRIHEWIDTYDVLAMAYDTPVPGYRNDVVNTLRLWSAKATRDFDISYFNRGDYVKAVEEKSSTENITRILYPSDAQLAGKELRLKQEYFLVSATLQDVLRRHRVSHATVNNLPDYAIFQLNDTHPALAVLELMRLLIDEHHVPWDEAWSITRRCTAYTNHTILPEALERWPVWLLERTLPRHLQLLFDINHLFLEEVKRRYPGDAERVRRMSLVEEGGERSVHMAHLAIVGSSRVNGVSALHSRLIREQLFKDFDQMEPGKFINQTNGVTPRRWLLKANPDLAQLITSRIGLGWVTELEQLSGLRTYADDADFRQQWRAIKRKNKERLATLLWRTQRIDLDTNHLIDAHIKRIHEYKRQLLNILHVVSLYLAYRDEPERQGPARTFIFAGKAAPAYDMAKQIIHLISSVAAAINADSAMRRRLRVVFVPNYSVTWAETIIPASDVSEQISTAGTEASGTGNMKFAMNGALTLGTLDGATIEIKEAVGEENMFLFGLSAEEVMRTRDAGYDPSALYYSERRLRDTLDAIAGSTFSPDQPGRFAPIVESLLAGGDRYLVLADFLSYVNCQRSVEHAYADQERWTRMAIMNVANMGTFSSDRTIRGYARDIWHVPVRAPGQQP